MTHSKQAAKRVRQSNRQRLKNRSVKSAVRSALRAAVEAESAQARGELARVAASKTDKAVKAGVLHRNAANRRKSRLQRALNRLAAAK
jgi:small subunit ribosomal protein S20